MKRILLVDDDRVLLTSLRRALRGALGDVEVETHSYAPAGLDRARRQRFDVAIADLHMPVMDGIVFLRRMAEHQPHAARVVLASSADLERARRRHADDPLVHGWLPKPWGDEALRELIDAALAESRAARLRAREAFFTPDIELPNPVAPTLVAQPLAG